MIGKLGLIGDVHGEAELLERALEALRSNGVSVIACIGDVVDGGASVGRCCDLLEEHGVVTVAGNHDRWLLAEVARDLPEATDPRTVSIRARAFFWNACLAWWS